MKKLLTLSLLGVMLLNSCAKDKETIVEVQEVKLNQTTLNLVEEKTTQLEATVLPENAANKEIIWTSSNKEIATVSEEGVITAIKEGVAKIIASAKNEITGECELTVSAKKIPITEIVLSSEAETLAVGETFILQVGVAPQNTTSTELMVSNTLPEVASMDNTGTITALAEGETVIEFSCDNVNASITITVETKSLEITEVDIREKMTIFTGDTECLSSSVFPLETPDKTLIWTSSDNSIVKVDETGNITGIAEGEADITATAVNGVKGVCKVTVEKSNEAAGFRISPRVTISQNKSGIYRAAIWIEEFTEVDKDRTYTWKSSDDTKVRMSDDGFGEFELNWKGYPFLELDNMNANDDDEVTITVTRDDGMTSECIVTVETAWNFVPSEYIVIYQNQEFTIGTDAKIYTKISPDNSTDQSFIFYNTDDNVATISEDGTIHPIKVGTTIVSAYSVESGAYQRISVLIKE